ncbi:MAG: amidohydrolase family protein [Acidobacteriota bacterium]|nr:amidohydrolase family protein [Acidobacteriota bacterium]
MIRSGISVETGLPVEIEFDTHIRAIRPGEDRNRFVAPAFLDIQVNGFAGVDYNSGATPRDEIVRSADAIRRTGVARFFPTVITAPPEDMVAALRNLAQAPDRSIEGFHIEGPHLSPEDGPRGAHPLASIRPPDLAEYRRWQDAAAGRIRLITVSPHWPHAALYIEELVSDGVTVSIGHTHATSQQISDASAAGATMSTHLGNAAHAVIRKQPNYIWDQLADDRLTASFIADGIHLGRAFLKSAMRAKTAERTVLVTDASSPAAAAPGLYRLGQQEIALLEDGRVVLAGTDRLAGSALQMHDAIANAMQMAELPLIDAVRMATVNPAGAVRMSERQRGLIIGERADLVFFTLDQGRLNIQETIVSN